MKAVPNNRCRRSRTPATALSLLLLSLLLGAGNSCTRAAGTVDDPWRGIPSRLAHTDHGAMLQGPFADGPSVTRRCLECHPESGAQMLKSVHWTWISDEAILPGETVPSGIGKKNLLNNFCISIAGNWGRCTSCHAGYGWADNSFDFTVADHIDCLICHDQSGGYIKDPNGAGLPAEGVDLEAAARSVGRPTRHNCGACHFNGGGGNAVKHGDLDMTMQYPSPRIDVHMGKHEMDCVDCHRTADHVIGGHLPATGDPKETCITCTDCHATEPHADARLNQHVATVACQVCHIPYFALQTPTKMSWDWAAAGQEEPPAVEYFDPEKEHHYQKIKGSFIYEENVIPEYRWYSERVERYLPGQQFDPAVPLLITDPIGDIDDPAAKIWPFKLHSGRQIYDTKYNYLLKAKTYGEGGFWTEFDWDKALRLGAEAGGLPYSGEYGFAETKMYWPITHMVQAGEFSLQCTDCHGPHGHRLDWVALGYPGDPLDHGSRSAGQTQAAGEVR